MKESKRVEEVLQSPEFIKHYNYVYAFFNYYLNRHSVYRDLYKKLIVFFSPEYGLHHSLLIYAGGLGFLAGDILKESSDLDFPLIGIGFMYPQGYVKQRIRYENKWDGSR